MINIKGMDDLVDKEEEMRAPRYALKAALVLVLAFSGLMSESYGAWQISTLDTAGDVGDNSSLALDSSGNPHISYNSETEKSIKYAYWNGTAWVIQKVADGPDVGWGTSLALFSSTPYISFHDEPFYDLKLAQWQ